jgi:hypothetical protein
MVITFDIVAKEWGFICSHGYKRHTDNIGCRWEPAIGIMYTDWRFYRKILITRYIINET